MSAWSNYLSKFEIIATTLTAQFYRIGLCGKGALIVVGTVCGNALLVSSSFQKEGFDSIVTGVYGLGVVTFSTLELVTSIIFIQVEQLNSTAITYYLVFWCWINLLFFLRSIKYQNVLSSSFFGFVVCGTLLEILSQIKLVTLGVLPNYILIASVIFPIVEISYGIVSMNTTADFTTGMLDVSHGLGPLRIPAPSKAMELV